MNRYIPRCCFVRPDGAKGYEVCHEETSVECRHDGSGGEGGRQTGRPCNRIIGNGRTRGDAIEDARRTLGFEPQEFSGYE
mgnify:CR=1 FL=1